ncbi:MAG: hypothetical protein HQ522_10375 [Bacteroidetes bacterium]|nr:hypothetical protein [Bacteroidota bacterium]
MKRNLSITGTFALAILLLSSFSLRENPQDPPRGKKGQKHIKMVKIDEDGKRMELDTILEGKNVFVWEGDTIGKDGGMKWISKGDFDMDFDMDFDIDVEETADGKVIIMKSGKGGYPVIHEFKMGKDGVHGAHDVMLFHGDKGNNKMLFQVPNMPGVPHAPKVLMMKKQGQGNVIDLSDPGIISYDKKKMKNGTEKITIVRKQVAEKDIELHEEILMNGGVDRSMMLHEVHPGKTQMMKIIKSDDGNVEIFEDGKLINIKEGSGTGRFITDDGNVYHIKETKEGNEKKVEVKVEVEEEIEKEEK